MQRAQPLNYLLPIWLTQHYAQLANYHLLKFEAGISKKANIKEAVSSFAAYGKCIV